MGVAETVLNEHKFCGPQKPTSSWKMILPLHSGI